MSPELDKLLCERYPKIFANRHGDVTKTAMVWGFDCHDGWFDLIDHLCRQIQWHLDKNAKEGTNQFVCDQVKEKFGTLRFYGHGGDERIWAFIQFAEGFSSKICETCGKPGKIRGRGYIYTACDEHTNKEDLENSNEPKIS